MARFDDLFSAAPAVAPKESFDTLFEAAPSREDAAAKRLAAADPSLPQMMPDTSRSWGELASDLGSSLKLGATEAVTALTDAPRRAANFLTGTVLPAAGAFVSPYPTETFAPLGESMRIERPEAQTDFMDFQRQNIAGMRDDMSARAYSEQQALGEAEGVGGVADALFSNPGLFLTEGGRMAGNLLPVVAAGPLALPAAGATFGSMAADQVEQALLSDPDALANFGQAARETIPELANASDADVLAYIADTRATDAGAASALINSILPKMIPGGATLEKALTRVPGGGSRAANVGRGFGGELGTEFLQGGADQAVQNVALGDPLGQGVLEAGALEGLLAGPLGGAMGALQSPEVQQQPEITPEQVEQAISALAQQQAGPEPASVPPASGREAAPAPSKAGPAPATAPANTDAELDSLLERELGEQMAQPEPAPEPAEGVPFLITNAMKAQLRERGFAPGDIARMKPADAQAILSQPVPDDATLPDQEVADGQAETAVAGRIAGTPASAVRDADGRGSVPGAVRTEQPAAGAVQRDAGPERLADQPADAGVGVPAADDLAPLRREVADATSDWQNAPAVNVARNLDDLPEDVKRRAKASQQQGTPEGLFDPQTNTVHLFGDAISDPKRARWVTIHEVAGHYGIRGAVERAGGDLSSEIARARGNSTISAVADAIASERGVDADVAVEEALAELAAADGTGDFAGIESRYGVAVPQSMRAGLRGAIARFVEAIKRALGGKAEFSDADWRKLIEGAYRYVREPAAEAASPASGAPLRSTRRDDDTSTMSQPVSDADESAYRDAVDGGRRREALRILHRAAGISYKDSSYDRGGLHDAPDPESGSPAWDVASSVYPEDVYGPNGLRYYGTGEDRLDAEALSIIRRVDGMPNAAVRVYRAVEKDAPNTISPGDWVTTVRQYAKEHGEGAISGDFKIVSKAVKARDIFTAGDSWLEWGYHPQPFLPEIPKGSGKAAPLQRLVESHAKRNSSDAPRFSTAPAPSTPQFREWFGESKATTPQGAPLRLFHGTGEDFTVFRQQRLGEATQHATAPLGFHLTDNRQRAQQYASNAADGRPADERVMELFASIQSPYEMSLDEAQSIESPEQAQQVRERLEREGYDGIYQPQTGSWIAFYNDQLKSATDNTGDFDRSNPDIRFSYSPAQEAALAKAGLAVEKRSTLQRAGDFLKDEWGKIREAARDSDALKQAVFDRFHGLRSMSAEVGLDDPTTDPYVAARMTTGLPAIIEGLMLYGAPKWDQGSIAIKDGTKGLLDALKPVEGALNDWLGWMVGRRAQLLLKQGRENNFTQEDIDALLSLANGREDAFRQAAIDYTKIKTAVLDVAEEAGLIDPDQRKAWDHSEYVPFYRQENEGAVGPGTRRGLANQSSGIRQLKGGENALADPLANIIRNFAKLIDASTKNRAVLLAVDQYGAKVFEKAPREMQPAAIPLDQVKRVLLDQGMPQSAIDAMPMGALRGVQRMLSIVPPSGEDVVRVMRDGKAEYWKVKDPLVLRSLTAFRQPQKNIAIKPFIWFKRLLTTGVTTTAEFIGANFIRDTGSAWVISDDRFIPGWDSLKGIGNTLRNDPGTRDMMMAGATFMGGNFYDGNPDAAAAALRRALRKKGLSNARIEGFMGTVARSPLQLWDAWMRLSSAVENANRRAVYDAALRAGRTRTEAAFMSRDLMDFSMQGDAAWVQFFGDVLPFFNARLQGMYKLGRRAAAPGGKRAMILRGGVLTLASAALYAWNVLAHGEAWDELEEWDKDTYWHIAPGTEHHVRIPKPFELGLVFGTAPERSMEAIRRQLTDNGDRPSDTWDALVRAITGTLAFNPIPQGALPLVEQWANKRFFTGRPIENMGDERLLPEARAEWYTSDTMKELGRLSGISPKRLEHLWSGYTAGLGGYVLDAADVAVRMVKDGPERPEMAKRDWPVLGRFLRGGSPGRSKYTERFYDRMREAEQVEQTVKELWVTGEKEAANALAEKHAELLGERMANNRAKGGFQFAEPKRLRKVRTQISDIRDQIEAIVLGSLPADEKRRKIDELEAERNRLVKQAVKD